MKSSSVLKTLAAAVLLAASVAGCSKTPTTTSGPGAPASDATSTSHAIAGIGRGNTVTLGKNVGPVAVGPHHLYFPSSPSDDGDWDRVTSVPLTTGPAATVAHTEFPHGLINWVAASRDGWIYYVDQSMKQSDTSPEVLWRVIGIDPATGRKRQLASNGDNPDAFVPIVRSQGEWAFWTSAETDRTAREFLWKPGWPKPRDLLRHVEMTPGSESINGNELVYLGPAATGANEHTTGGDCWTVPLVGGVPRAITHTALALGCAASDGWIVWSQHLGPQDTVPEVDGILDDPFTLMAQHDDSTPVALHRGYFSLASLYVSGDKAVWQNTDGFRVVQDLDHPGTQTVLAADGPALSVAVDTDHLVITHRRASRIEADVIALHRS